MNQTDELKLLRLQDEKRYINADFIEGLARQLIDELVEWSNDEIFAPLGGELTFDITLGPPNAGVRLSRDRPFNPHMEFRSSLISDIYADAFSFPIVCRRMVQETDTIKNFHESDERFRNSRVRFDSALPKLHESNVAERFRPVCESFVKRNLEVRSDYRQLQPDDVRCRFIMFELMLVWTFFHELGHIVQGHHRMRSEGPSLVSEIGYFEMESPAPALGDEASAGTAGFASKSEPDIAAQARELMADAEATDQTLKYLALRGRLNFNVWYLLLSSTGCMFQRFYTGYPDSLELSRASHPHPAIRDEASQLLSLNWVADYLVASKNIRDREEAALQLAYLSVRASLVTGLFRSHRMEKRESEDGLPSYMRLIREGAEQQKSYLRALLPELERQLPVAVEYHLIKMHSLGYWFDLVKASVSQSYGDNAAGGAGAQPSNASADS